MGEARVDDVTRLAAATSSKDPHVGLAAVAALRALVEVLEALQVDNARAKEANRLRHGYVGPARVLLAHGLDLAGDPPAVVAGWRGGLDAVVRQGAGRQGGVAPGGRGGGRARPARGWPRACAAWGAARRRSAARRPAAEPTGQADMGPSGPAGPGASPVGRVVQGRGLTLEQLRAAVLAELHAPT